ncbi:MAG: hypothetical protein HY020_25680 [Burkholderiales bacterium]|nr:hypothetical protein [Burkholderiales bacterium]
MRRTPPVAVLLQPQAKPVVRAVVALIALLAAGGLAARAIVRQPQAWAALLAVSVISLRARRAAAELPRWLRWNGQALWLAKPDRDEEAAVQRSVLIDLDAWLLLRATRLAAPRVPS